MILSNGKLSLGVYHFPDRKRPALCVNEGNSLVKWAINNIPSVDAVEVVRCRDCKRSEMYRLFNEKEETLCCCDIEDGEIVFAQRVGENHFCSYGERKEDNAR